MPLIVRGPGVPEGRTLDHMVLNNDLAPTFADLEGARTPAFVDGRSLVPLLDDDPTPVEDWRQRFVLEGVAERSGVAQPPFITESTVVPLLTGDPLPNNWRRRTSAASAQLSEEWGRPWMKARERTTTFTSNTRPANTNSTTSERTPTNCATSTKRASPDLKQRLEAQLDALRRRRGMPRCRRWQAGSKPSALSQNQGLKAESSYFA